MIRKLLSYTLKSSLNNLKWWRKLCYWSDSPKVYSLSNWTFKSSLSKSQQQRICCWSHSPKVYHFLKGPFTRFDHCKETSATSRSRGGDRVCKVWNSCAARNDRNFKQRAACPSSWGSHTSSKRVNLTCTDASTQGTLLGMSLTIANDFV